MFSSVCEFIYINLNALSIRGEEDLISRLSENQEQDFVIVTGNETARINR